MLYVETRNPKKPGMALGKIKSFFRRMKVKAKAEEPKAAPEAAKKEPPQAPEKKG